MKKNKIAIIGSRGYPIVYGGYETFVTEVAPRFTAKNIEVHVYCQSHLFKKKPNQVNSIFLHYIPCINTKQLNQITTSFFSTLHALFNKYDLILYVNSVNGLFGFITKLFKIKTIINVDGIEWQRPKWKGLGAKVFYISAKMAVKWMDIIITDAEEMKKLYFKEFGVNSIMIAYGANIKYSTNKDLIKKWDLIKDEYYLIVGRLIPDNNAYFILSSFILSNTTKEIVVVGDVPFQDEYSIKIKMLKDPRIKFVGYINDPNELSELYFNCFAYFHGHEFGGTNPTLLKALAFGCMILALNTVFSKEVLMDKQYGLYFTKNDNSIKELINYLENNLDIVNIYKLKARNRILENYTWEKITDQYIHEFEKLTYK